MGDVTYGPVSPARPTCALEGVPKLWTSLSPSGNCDSRKYKDFFFFFFKHEDVRILVGIRFKYSTQTNSSRKGNYCLSNWEAQEGLDSGA